MSKKSKISFCVTVKNRSIITYKSADEIYPKEQQAMLGQDNMLINAYGSRQGFEERCPGYKLNSELIKEPNYNLQKFAKSINNMAEFWKDYYNVELIISDWKSTDVDVYEEAKKVTGEYVDLRVRYIDQEVFSRGYGLNECAKYATGDILHFTDTDMRYESMHLLKEMVDVCQDDKAWFPIMYKETTPCALQLYNEVASLGMCAMNRDVFDKTGGYLDIRKWGGEDDAIYKSVINEIGIENIVRKPAFGLIHTWHSDKARF